MPFVPFLRPVPPLGRVSFAFQFSTYSLKSSSGSQVTPYPIVENYSCLLPSQLCLPDIDHKMPGASYMSSVLCTHSKSMQLFCRIAMLKELGASRLANLALPLPLFYCLLSFSFLFSKWETTSGHLIWLLWEADEGLLYPRNRAKFFM